MQLIFKIPGEPKGKGRPRFARKGSYVHTYTPDSTAAYEEKVKRCYYQQCGNRNYFDKDEMLQVHILAKYPIPKSISQKKRGMMIAHRLRPVVKPDADNIIKIVCDALNGIAYGDDKQIVDAHFHKIYSTEPGVQVMICTAGDFIEGGSPWETEAENEQAFFDFARG